MIPWRALVSYIVHCREFCMIHTNHSEAFIIFHAARQIHARSAVHAVKGS